MISKSTYPTIDIPDLDIWGFLFESTIPFPGSKVIYHDHLTARHYTYDDLKATASAFGYALRTQWNWSKGDVVATFAVNSIDTPVVTLGTLWANGVVSPSNPGYSVKELAYQLKNSGAKAIVTQAHLLQTVYEATALAGIPKDRVLLIGDVWHSSTVHFQDFIRPARNTKTIKRVVQDSNDLAFIPYSSGTTGLAKGVMLTQRNIVCNLLQLDTVLPEDDFSWKGGPSDEGDVLVAVLPLYHIYGLTLLILHTVHRGVKVVMLPAFTPDTFLGAIEKHKVTIASVVPPILLFLAQSPLVAKYDLSSLRWMMSAAAPLSTQLILEVTSRLTVAVKQAYGMTETSPTLYMQKTSEWKKHIGSVGKLVNNVIAQYVSEAGEVLPIGEAGEIWVKGPNVFPGYFRNPKATKASITEDGWYKTGDIGYEDKDGNLFITDRLKELIKYKGFQVAPAELEGLLISHEKVADACVVGLYDESQVTELPLAFLVKAPAFSHLPDAHFVAEVRAWVDKQVSNHKKLRGGIRIVNVIPKSAAGKILRRVLRDQLTAEVASKKAKAKL